MSKTPVAKPSKKKWSSGLPRTLMNLARRLWRQAESMIIAARLHKSFQATLLLPVIFLGAGCVAQKSDFDKKLSCAALESRANSTVCFSRAEDSCLRFQRTGTALSESEYTGRLWSPLRFSVIDMLTNQTIFESTEHFATEEDRSGAISAKMREFGCL